MSLENSKTTRFNECLNNVREEEGSGERGPRGRSGKSFSVLLRGAGGGHYFAAFCVLASSLSNVEIRFSLLSVNILQCHLCPLPSVATT